MKQDNDNTLVLNELVHCIRKSMSAQEQYGVPVAFIPWEKSPLFVASCSLGCSTCSTIQMLINSLLSHITVTDATGSFFEGDTKLCPPKSTNNFTPTVSTSEWVQDSQYPWKTSLDTIWTSPIGDGHLTPSQCPHTILGIVGCTGRIRTWDLDILTHLKILHMVQVEPSKLDNFDFFTASFLKPFWLVLPN
jgi:hypothetical protein